MTKRNYSQTVRRIHDVILEIHRARSVYAQTSFLDYRSSFELMQQLFPSWVVMICGIRNHTIPYVSENCRQLFGYTSRQMCAMSLEEEFDHVHPDDQEAMNLSMQHLLAFTKNIQNEAFDRYRFVMQYRYRRANGEYFHLQDEKLALRSKDHHFLHFTLYKDVTQEKPFSQVRVEIYKLEKDTYQKIDTFVPALSQQPITRREKEILQLIQYGQSNKEIADRLFISEHTARNHRSNLFEKAKARNVIELLNYARSAQWI